MPGLDIPTARVYVGQPEWNGVIERFIRTMEEQCLYLHCVTSFEEVRQVIGDFIIGYKGYKTPWLIERIGYRTPPRPTPQRGPSRRNHVHHQVAGTPGVVPSPATKSNEHIVSKPTWNCTLEGRAKSIPSHFTLQNQGRVWKSIDAGTGNSDAVCIQTASLWHFNSVPSFEPLRDHRPSRSFVNRGSVLKPARVGSSRTNRISSNPSCRDLASHSNAWSFMSRAAYTRARL